MEKYQTLMPRLFALIIDALIFLPLSFLDIWIKEANLFPVMFSVWLLVMNMVHPVYSILMHGFYGQTLGKMAMKIKVVDTYEKPITFHHAVLRELPQLSFNFSLMFFAMQRNSNVTETSDFFSYSAENIILFLMLGWSIADIAVFLVNDKHRALHDFIAGTVVIKTNM